MVQSDTMRLRPIRILRVFGTEDGQYSRWILIEDSQRARFQQMVYLACVERPRDDFKVQMDRDDIWNILNSLRSFALLGFDIAELVVEDGSPNSIDTAVSNSETASWELMKRVQRKINALGEAASRSHDPRGATAGNAAPIDQGTREIVVTPGRARPQQEIERMIKDTWDFAGGKPLWRSIGRTAAGRPLEVLTIDGSEELLVGQTSISAPAKSR
jgi:hypothetical protein